MKQRNRAKCRLCKQIIESLTAHDLQLCSCGEISVDGGTQYYKASFHDPYNFLRVDDDGNEIEVTFEDATNDSVKDWHTPPADNTPANTPLDRETLLGMLEMHIDGYENLPDHAKHAPCSIYDLQCLAILVNQIFRA